MSNTPHMDKVELARQQGSQEIGAFLEWLHQQGIQFYRYPTKEEIEMTRAESGWRTLHPDTLISDYTSTQDWLYRYFRINRDAYDQELKDLLKQMAGG